MAGHESITAACKACGGELPKGMGVFEVQMPAIVDDGEPGPLLYVVAKSPAQAALAVVVDVARLKPVQVMRALVEEMPEDEEN